MLEHKQWRKLARSGQQHHLAIILFLRGRPARYHTHDFPEVFWIERGRALHRINGVEKSLEGGDLVFIRPEDEHVLAAVDDKGFTLVNLAYDPLVRRDLIARYGRDVSTVLASRAQLPPRFHLAPIARARLSPLAAEPKSRLVLEHFLAGLILQSQAGDRLRPLPPMPEWLQRACEQVQRPELMAQGVPGFVRAAGRRAEHVARSTRIALGVTPSDYLNQVRMEHAARELRITNRSITDIALGCGLNNLSHFYALFRAAHGQTPRRYRQALQQPII